MNNGRWLRLGVALLPLCATPVLAANPDNGPGCGLGKLAWSDYRNQKDIAPQVMMATTNGTFGSQTFGISSGTSGCTNNGVIMSEHKASVFAALNFENLSQDMARGSGEHLSSLAELMNVPQENRSEFYSLAQLQYQSMVQSGETTPAAMLKALNTAMSSHPTLAKATLK
jgi:Protein of unknown function (DUF3015)